MMQLLPGLGERAGQHSQGRPADRVARAQRRRRTRRPAGAGAAAAIRGGRGRGVAAGVAPGVPGRAVFYRWDARPGGAHLRAGGIRAAGGTLYDGVTPLLEWRTGEQPVCNAHPICSWRPANCRRGCDLAMLCERTWDMPFGAEGYLELRIWLRRWTWMSMRCLRALCACRPAATPRRCLPSRCRPMARCWPLAAKRAT